MSFASDAAFTAASRVVEDAFALGARGASATASVCATTLRAVWVLDAASAARRCVAVPASLFAALERAEASLIESRAVGAREDGAAAEVTGGAGSAGDGDVIDVIDETCSHALAPIVRSAAESTLRDRTSSSPHIGSAMHGWLRDGRLSAPPPPPVSRRVAATVAFEEDAEILARKRARREASLGKQGKEVSARTPSVLSSSSSTARAPVGGRGDDSGIGEVIVVDDASDDDVTLGVTASVATPALSATRAWPAALAARTTYVGSAPLLTPTGSPQSLRRRPSVLLIVSAEGSRAACEALPASSPYADVLAAAARGMAAAPALELAIWMSQSIRDSAASAVPVRALVCGRYFQSHSKCSESAQENAIREGVLSALRAAAVHFEGAAETYGAAGASPGAAEIIDVEGVSAVVIEDSIDCFAAMWVDRFVATLAEPVSALEPSEGSPLFTRGFPVFVTEGMSRSPLRFLSAALTSPPLQSAREIVDALVAALDSVPVFRGLCGDRKDKLSCSASALMSDADWVSIAQKGVGGDVSAAAEALAIAARDEAVAAFSAARMRGGACRLWLSALGAARMLVPFPARPLLSGGRRGMMRGIIRSKRFAQNPAYGLSYCARSLNVPACGAAHS